MSANAPLLRGKQVECVLFELAELVDSARRLAGEALEIAISRDAGAADRAA